MKTFGLSQKQWGILYHTALKPLVDSGATLWVFGSRATGSQKEFSDIDILIENAKGSTENILPVIRAELEDSDLTIKVDLVLENELAESYKKNIEKQKVRIPDQNHSTA